MKQIDKLAWIEIKDKKKLNPKLWKNTIPGGKREAEMRSINKNKEKLSVILKPVNFVF
jgi:hypothetical protein